MYSVPIFCSGITLKTVCTCDRVYLYEAESRRLSLGLLAQSTFSRMRMPSPAVLEATSLAESEGNTTWNDTWRRTD